MDDDLGVEEDRMALRVQETFMVLWRREPVRVRETVRSIASAGFSG